LEKERHVVERSSSLKKLGKLLNITTNP